MADACPPPEELSAWVDGTLSAEARERMLAHVARCDDCREAGALLAKIESSGAPGRTPAVEKTPDPEDASSPVPSAGERFAHFRIEKVLGRGGMGVVLRARDERLDRDVALKLVTAETPESGARLAREAKALAALRHPNLVTVFDVGIHDGRAYLVMELLEGANLRVHVSVAKPGWRVTLSQCRQAAQGLSALHEAGFVHRDIKPDNIVVTKDGRVVVVDLGLAKRSEERDAPESVRTKTGAIVGTPRYLAPELLAGGVAGARSDVYSFAATVRELVTSSSGSAPPRLLAVLARGMDPNPARRHDSVDALSNDLGAALLPRSTLIGLGLGVLAAIGVGAFALTRDPPPRIPAVAPSPGPEMVALAPSSSASDPAPAPISIPSATATASATATTVAPVASSAPAVEPPRTAQQVASVPPVFPSGTSWIAGNGVPITISPTAHIVIASATAPVQPVFTPAWMKQMGYVPTTYDAGAAVLDALDLRCDGDAGALPSAPRRLDFGPIEKLEVLQVENEKGETHPALLVQVKGQRRRVAFSAMMKQTYLDAAVGSWLFFCAGPKQKDKLPTGWDGEMIRTHVFGPIAGPPAWSKRKPAVTYLDQGPFLKQRNKLKFGIEPTEWMDGDGPLIFAVEAPPETPLKDGPAYVKGYFLEADATLKNVSLLSGAAKKKPVWVIAHFVRIAEREESRRPVVRIDEVLPSLFDPPKPKP